MGSALVHELETNCASCTRIVKATRNPREEGDVFVDLEDAESISRALEIVKPNVIFHLAGAFFPCEKEDAHRLIVKPNVVGTENLMTAASEHNVVRVAMVSSMAAVRGGGQVPLDGVAFSFEDYNTESKPETGWGGEKEIIT